MVTNPKIPLNPDNPFFAQNGSLQIQETPMIRKFFPMMALVVCILFATQVAKADTYSFSINNFGQGGSLGIVTTTLVGGTIQVSVQMNPNYIIHGAGVGLNVNPLFTRLNITNISTPSGPNLFVADLASHNFDGFGTFAPSA